MVPDPPCITAAAQCGYSRLRNETIDVNIGRLLPKPCGVLVAPDRKDYLDRLVAEVHQSALEDIRTVVENGAECDIDQRLARRCLEPCRWLLRSSLVDRRRLDELLCRRHKRAGSAQGRW